MKARVEACRALAYYTSGLLDRAHAASDRRRRQRNLCLAEFLTPIVKGGSTEMAIEVTSLGIQIHGGMGYIEETGAAQYWRDARITTDLRGHHRHPGQRPALPQAAARPGRDREIRVRRSGRHRQGARCRRRVPSCRGSARVWARRLPPGWQRPNGWAQMRNRICRACSPPQCLTSISRPSSAVAGRWGAPRLRPPDVSTRRGGRGFLPCQARHGALLRRPAAAAGRRAGRNGQGGRCGVRRYGRRDFLSHTKVTLRERFRENSARFLDLGAAGRVFAVHAAGDGAMMAAMPTIAIVSDIVCPWCFIGKRRLEAAVAMVRRDYPDCTWHTRWLPFFLNPDTPPAGRTLPAFPRTQVRQPRRGRGAVRKGSGGRAGPGASTTPSTGSRYAPIRCGRTG